MLNFSQAMFSEIDVKKKEGKKKNFWWLQLLGCHFTKQFL